MIFILLFKLTQCPIHWMVYVLAYLNVILEFQSSFSSAQNGPLCPNPFGALCMYISVWWVKIIQSWSCPEINGLLNAKIPNQSRNLNMRLKSSFENSGHGFSCCVSLLLDYLMVDHIDRYKSNITFKWK